MLDRIAKATGVILLCAVSLRVAYELIAPTLPLLIVLAILVAILGLLVRRRL